MSEFSRREEIDRALALLGRNMALAYAEDTTLLCCGGAALCMFDLLPRTTKDVDAIGVVVNGAHLEPIETFSPEMERAVIATARALNLAEDWLNGAASSLLARGLPEGTLLRATSHRRTYGPCLTIFFLDRLDLIALKLFAAMDPTKGRRHQSDLVALAPSEAEISHGLRWMLAWKTNEAFRQRLRFLVEGLGHPTLAASLAASAGDLRESRG